MRLTLNLGKRHSWLPICLCLAVSAGVVTGAGPEKAGAADRLAVNDQEYLEMPGLNVMLANDFYPEGHQGGVGIIQNGRRVATNGDLRLEATPGQWQAVPKVGERMVDRKAGEISVRLEYPDPARERQGFNPVEYPDLHFGYVVRIKPAGRSFRIIVDLDRPLPEAWVGRVGFNLELFPGILFGRTYDLDGQVGYFPRQDDGPGAVDARGDYQALPLAAGRKLVIAPESDEQRMTIEAVAGGDLALLDDRARHNNGWFEVRALVPKGAAAGAIEWIVTPHAIPGWMSPPVVQVSQVGYHPREPKIAVIELDKRDARRLPATLLRIAENGGMEKVLEAQPKDWGRFLRYECLQFDFTAVEKPGLYVIAYGDTRTAPFPISAAVFARHVWQPTLEYFLPIQMCHMRVTDHYRVWHGVCHLDDARMAPVDHVHFDGYQQGPSTLTSFQPGEHVPGLDRGGWHDAGDFDLRVESQSETVRGLTLVWEQFHPTYDETTIDQEHREVWIHQPDGKPDILQQIEHGALSIVGGYRALGRLYRGIIEPTLQQYVMLGDPVNLTDNRVFDPKTPAAAAPPVGRPGSADDRWVFTEDNPGRELIVGSGLAAGARALRGFNDGLARDCLDIARQLWDRTKEKNPVERTGLAVELLQTTGERKYADFLLGTVDPICAAIRGSGGDDEFQGEHAAWVAGRSLALIDDAAYREKIRAALRVYRSAIDWRALRTPYGVPYEPDVWGAGWAIQRFGKEQYFLHVACPDIFPADYTYRALNFILGCHPGANPASFVSGVGAKSLTMAYGFNRADGSYIPGGIASGTALIRPDFPELLEWPYLWQQTEYVLGDGTTDYLILVLGAQHLLNP